jgi:hypothetical protein
LVRPCSQYIGLLSAPRWKAVSDQRSAVSHRGHSERERAKAENRSAESRKAEDRNVRPSRG